MYVVMCTLVVSHYIVRNVMRPIRPTLEHRGVRESTDDCRRVIIIICVCAAILLLL